MGLNGGLTLKLFDDFKILTSITVIFLCLSFLASMDFASYGEENSAVKIDGSKKNKTENKKEDTDENEDGLKAFNGLAIGFDIENTRTDVMMVGHVDPKNEAINIISIPRDLNIDFTDPAFAEIKANNPNNNLYSAKLTDIYGILGADEQALDDVVSIIEVITGLEIDYVGTVRISGFKAIVDSIGGVEFDVPHSLDYEDPYQYLFIHLERGPQVLDGDKAEQLVRFRKGYVDGVWGGYPDGDYGRMKMQQSFIMAMAKQVMAERDFGKIKNLITTAYQYVDTDFGIIMVLEYADFFLNYDLESLISAENIVSIPSEGYLIDNVWLQIFNVSDSQRFVRELLEKNEKHGKYRGQIKDDETVDEE